MTAVLKHNRFHHCQQQLRSNFYLNIIMLETSNLQQKHRILSSTYFLRPYDTSACLEALPDCFCKQKVEWKKQLIDSYFQSVFSPQAYTLKMQDLQEEHVKLPILDIFILNAQGRWELSSHINVFVHLQTVRMGILVNTNSWIYTTWLWVVLYICVWLMQS